jgi:hypothetical protein
MAILVARAGLTLNAGQMADLVLSWRQLNEMMSRIPRNQPLLADVPLGYAPPLPARSAPGPRSRATAARRGRR